MKTGEAEMFAVITKQNEVLAVDSSAAYCESVVMDYCRNNDIDECDTPTITLISDLNDECRRLIERFCQATQLTDEMIRELCIACTRNASGQHFTEWMNYADELEAFGLIEIHRPRETGIEYSQEHWSLEVTEAGQGVVDANPELHPTH
jgi:hypothetical protein